MNLFSRLLPAPTVMKNRASRLLGWLILGMLGLLSPARGDDPVYTFCDFAYGGGLYPDAALLPVPGGGAFDLYGTAFGSPDGRSNVYMIGSRDPNTNQIVAKRSFLFASGAYESNTISALLLSKDGNFYGVTYSGGKTAPAASSNSRPAARTPRSTSLTPTPTRATPPQSIKKGHIPAPP